MLFQDSEDIAIDLNGLFRYQDDCIVFGDGGTFEIIMCDIYPCPQLTLKCTNVKPKTCNYLDLTVSVYQGEYNYKSYDKRRDFKFDVVNYPDLSGNIPCRPAYGVFTSLCLKYLNQRILLHCSPSKIMNYVYLQFHMNTPNRFDLAL